MAGSSERTIRIAGPITRDQEEKMQQISDEFAAMHKRWMEEYVREILKNGFTNDPPPR